MSHRFSIALGGISQTFYIRHNHQGELYILTQTYLFPQTHYAILYNLYHYLTSVCCASIKHITKEIANHLKCGNR